MKSLKVAIDFDGTIVKHNYPEIGEPVPGAIEFMQKIDKAGHKIILYTMRSGDKLQEAVDYLNENGIYPFGVNNDPEQSNWTESPKAYAHVYIDDASLGCPLICPYQRRPFADFQRIDEMFDAIVRIYK